MIFFQMWRNAGTHPDAMRTTYTVSCLSAVGINALFKRTIIGLAIAALALAAGNAVGSPSDSDGSPSDPMPSLDEQVQEIKTDVLSIAAELANLEERLLFPSNTQVAVFVSLEEGDSWVLDSVQILVDGQPAANHIYTFKELEALRKGGVQRLYTGNVRTGEHRIEVAVAGKTAGGTEFSQAESFSFTKEVDPKLVGITLGSQALGGASIRLGDW